MMEQVSRCTWPPAWMKDSMVTVEEGGRREMVKGSVVVVLGKRCCYMSYVSRRLLQSLRANPVACEIVKGSPKKIALTDKVTKMDSENMKKLTATLLPIVFIWEKLIRGLDWLIGVHISCELVPILKKTGALWL
ncbi:putative glutaredoxin-like, plant II, Thioredoxin-like superfamily [Dioscorea sansibarensis]